MSKKILPVVQPPIACDKDDANILAVLWPHQNNENVKKWFIRNFIDLWCYDPMDTKEMGFDKPVTSDLHCFRPEGTKHVYFDRPFPDSTIHDCHLLTRVEYDRDTLEKKYDTIVDFVKETIENDYFMFFEIDCFYIPYALYNRRMHYNSRTLIFGYDDEEGVLHAADFYGPFDRNVAYKFREIKYSDFVNAYSSYECSKNINYERLVAFKYNPNKEIPLNKGDLKYALKRYMDGFEDSHNNIYFGIKCYDAVIDALQKKYVDFRVFNYISNHAKALRMRVEYLKEFGAIEMEQNELISFTELEKFALGCRNSLFKLVVSQDRTFRSKLIDQYQLLQEKDLTCTRLLVNSIKDAENVYRWSAGLKEVSNSKQSMNQEPKETKQDMKQHKLSETNFEELESTQTKAAKS